jgi:hypothetical protein
MIACGRSQGAEVVQKVLQSEAVQLIQGFDTLGVQDPLQLITLDFLDEHERLDLGQLNARDSFPRYLVLIGHIAPFTLSVVQNLLIERKARASRRSSTGRNPAFGRLIGEAHDAVDGTA